MAKNRPTHVSKPVYPGGNKALRKFVSSQLKYPPEALSAKVEGSVTVRYSLDYTGKVVDAKVKRGLGYGCDEEALRVVKLLRFEVPQSRKKKVRIHQDITINFKLPNTKTKPAPQQLSVSYTTTKKGSDSQGSTPEQVRYSYTIKW
ncbi:energy transducer TonB [Lewinella sp. W8]|uniref:energy transducer TonB n=1 Tax=Lewinella sp. W8 TaxID=2528208 RepID=UPI001068B211|nr:energy transducer TonB [Lewinella sp. W8]MTB51808.1 TonB family protein [Lewinella sp. W8]